MEKANEANLATKNTILVVDNEKSTILILKNVLKSTYEIITAQDGNSAIAKAIKHKPDIIMLDIIMPGISGYEVISNLKSNPQTAEIPVIFITALNDIKEEEHGLRLGAADYINKPINPAIVKLRVDNQIKLINYVRTIEKMNITDQLTNLHNRRSFDALVKAEWDRKARSNSYISMFMIDVDKFKLYNDTYGHQQGDIALQTVAKIIKDSVSRSTDIVARWGGEEFVVLISVSGPKAAMMLAEEIRANMEKAEILLQDGRVTKLTLSVGVNTLKSSDVNNNSMASFFYGADEALYQAKSSGRNCVKQYKQKKKIEK